MNEPEITPPLDELSAPRQAPDAKDPAPDTREPAAADGDLAAAQREIDELRDDLIAARARERALTFELQHRVRNMLATIRSIYRRTREAGASEDEFAEHFEGRLDAVARYQTQVDDVAPSTIEIEDMLRNELLEHHCLDTPKCMISGPPVHLRQKSAELMGLAIHELATNSIKFGALAQGGTLAARWSVEEGAHGSMLRFGWVESGVSIAKDDSLPSGFGRELIEVALPYQLDAVTSFDLNPGGVDCTILLPLPSSAKSREAVGELPSSSLQPEFQH